MAKEKHNRKRGALRSILAVSADWQSGHKLGIMSPEIVLYDEDEDGKIVPLTPELTAFQKMLWELQNKQIQSVNDIAGGDPVYYFHLGELAHGNKYPEQLVSNRQADQIAIVEANLKPWLSLANLKCARFVVGTNAHEFGEGSVTLIVANSLAGKYPDKDIKPLYYGLAHIDKCAIDYSHHGPGNGCREWLNGNIARLYLKSMVGRLLKEGREIPSLVLRGHIHVPVNEVVSEWINNQWVESRIIVVPSMCGPSDHARQYVQGLYEIVVGSVIIEIIDGEPLRPHWITKSFDIRTKEVLS